MKKVFTKFLLAISLNCFISASPSNGCSLVTVSVVKSSLPGGYVAPKHEARVEDIHPLDLLALKFN